MAVEIKYDFKVGYRCWYDEAQGKYVCEEQTSTTGQYGDLTWWCKDLEGAKESVASKNESLCAKLEDLNTEMNTEAHIVLKCVDCGSLFVVTQRDYDWYKDRKLDVPKRCDKCRALRKANKEKNEKSGADDSKKKDIAYNGVCTCCGKKFYLTKSNYDWFIQQGYEIPKKCYDCRKAKKQTDKKS